MVASHYTVVYIVDVAAIMKYHICYGVCYLIYYSVYCEFCCDYAISYISWDVCALSEII